MVRVRLDSVDDCQMAAQLRLKRLVLQQLYSVVVFVTGRPSCGSTIGTLQHTQPCHGGYNLSHALTMPGDEILPTRECDLIVNGPGGTIAVCQYFGLSQSAPEYR